MLRSFMKYVTKTESLVFHSKAEKNLCSKRHQEVSSEVPCQKVPNKAYKMTLVLTLYLATCGGKEEKNKQEKKEKIHFKSVNITAIPRFLS